jgi:hypothetical protein
MSTTRRIHPFLIGARKPSMGMPDTFKAKSGRTLPCLRLITPGIDKMPAKTFGAREQARAARRIAA